MRKFIVLLAAAVVCACTGSDDIRISFEGSDLVGREVVMIYHTVMKNVPLDEDGKGEVVLEGIDAAYVTVYYGQQSRQIYVERGDCAKVSFDGRDFMRSFSFEGEKKQVVDYLNTITLPSFSDEAYALPLDEFAERLAALESGAVKILEATDLGKDGDFEYMENGRIRYSYATPLLMYPLGHSLMTGNREFVPSSDYYELLREYFVEDDRLVDLTQYRDFIVEAAHVLDRSADGVKGLYGRTVAQMKYIAETFESPKVRQHLLHYLAAPYVEQFGIDGIDELQNIYRTYVKDPLLVADYQAKYDKWDVAKAGSMSPDFVAEDLSGRKWTLADFKGKYVYIDIWATWCGPCRREIPYLKQLEEEFHDADIAFVSLSVDQDKSKWVSLAGEMSGVQLYLGTDSKFVSSYGIRSIPRFILLDKDGRIISTDMSRPSSEDTRKTLNALEGIR